MGRFFQKKKRLHFILNSVYFFKKGFWILLSLYLSSCFKSDIISQTPSTTTTKPTSTTSTSSTFQTAPGARAVRILFKNANPGGSFSAPPSGGTLPGAGLSAVRLFNADGSLLVDGGPSASTWPLWIKKVEIGISGSNNTSAPHTDCARFATTADSNALCDFNRDGTFDSACGAPEGVFRVSEYDCAQGSGTTTGTGGNQDGVYIKIVFSRNTLHLAAHENILAVLQYAASVLNPAPQDPTSCFSGGLFDPTQLTCSDMSWQIFIKHNESEIVQPYLLLVPPALGHVDTTQNLGGSGVATKQWIIPLAGDPNLTVLQISRIRSLPLTAPNFLQTCKTNSAFCLGMVFYSLTLFRI